MKNDIYFFKKNYKPYLFSILLDLRFKMIHFKENGLLYFYSNISKDILLLFKYKYFKIKKEIIGKSTINSNISFDELNDESTLKTNSNSESSDSDDEIFISSEITEDEYIIFVSFFFFF